MLLFGFTFPSSQVKVKPGPGTGAVSRMGRQGQPPPPLLPLFRVRPSMRLPHHSTHSPRCSVSSFLVSKDRHQCQRIGSTLKIIYLLDHWCVCVCVRVPIPRRRLNSLHPNKGCGDAVDEVLLLLDPPRSLSPLRSLSFLSIFECLSPACSNCSDD